MSDSASPAQPVAQTSPPARCGALNKNGNRCGSKPAAGGWTCQKHAGWIDTASDEERQQLAWMEIQEMLAALADPVEEDPEAAWREKRLTEAERLLFRLMDQERIRHRGDLAGSALEADLADALRVCFALRFGRRALETFDLVRQAHPTGGGFDPDCRCSTCREMQAAELVPALPGIAVRKDDADEYGYVTFRAWLTGASQRTGGSRRIPQRATALQLALLAGQAKHMEETYPELRQQVGHEQGSATSCGS